MAMLPEYADGLPNICGKESGAPVRRVARLHLGPRGCPSYSDAGLPAARTGEARRPAPRDGPRSRRPARRHGRQSAGRRTRPAPATAAARRTALPVVVTGPYAGEAFDGPALASLFPRRTHRPEGTACPVCRATSSALTTVRPPPRSTTTTTNSPASSPHHWPSAHPATPASASPTRDDCRIHPAPTWRPRPDLIVWQRTLH
jgi:hypothetical protein